MSGVIPQDANGNKAIYNSDGSSNVQVTGRKAKVMRTDYSQALSVVAGSTTTITITPPVGEIWRVKQLRINIPAAVGATAGTHRFIIGLFEIGTDGGILDITSNFGDTIATAENTIAFGTSSKIPATDTAQQNAITNIVISNDTPLKLWYSNNTTGGTQSGTATIKMIREVEYVV